MGNVEVTDLAPVRSDERKELNISRKVNYRQYCKHVQRQYSEACLMELPWSLRDSISLYERMDVSFHMLTELPVELPLRLPHLNYLNLSYNKLSALPESFSLLFHLKTLLLSHNLIQYLPKSFIHLVKLEKLDISHNSLRELPEDMGKMESLKKINISNNKLHKLPISFGTSQLLTSILAAHNRLTFPPQNVCNEGSDAILRYLKRNSTNGVIIDAKRDVNHFPRIRGNQVASAVINPHSAQAQYIQTQTDTTNTPSRIKTPLLPPLGSSRLDALDLRDRIIGLIYGAALGDAVGIATQFMDRDECEFHYNKDDLHYHDIVRDLHRTRWRPGDWTCYFDHFVLVLDSLIQWGGVIDELDFVKRLHSWSKTGFPELGDSEGYTFCNTIIKVINTDGHLESPHLVAQSLVDGLKKQQEVREEREIDDENLDQFADNGAVIRSAVLGKGVRGRGQAILVDGLKKQQEVREDREIDDENLDQFADNGAVIRSAILGIAHFHDLEEVVENTIRICKSTHADPRCVATSVWVAVTIAIMLKGEHNLSTTEGVEELITAANKVAKQQLQEGTHIQEFERYLSVKDIDGVEVTQPGRIVYVYKPVASAVAALRQKLDFKSAISDLVMRGGDSCANASVTGAILGCKEGYSALPKPWLHDLRKKQTDWLNAKVNALLDMMGIP